MQTPVNATGRSYFNINLIQLTNIQEQKNNIIQILANYIRKTVDPYDTIIALDSNIIIPITDNVLSPTLSSDQSTQPSG